ncbi:MAG TPA: hypothetical protein VFR19_00370 [Hyphomicrobiaceae bacterium]|jgi:hypothetical protein|nr:hypothetical protein [Hyphomicrobiaceae bacterium]
MGASNLLIEEAARLIERLETRLEQQRAQLLYCSPDGETAARTAAKIARMERGLERLRLCSEMLSHEQGRRDDRLIRERNAFAKQYKRKWRPSRRPE